MSDVPTPASTPAPSPESAGADRHLLVEIADGIMTLTLNRPDKLNAYTNQMGNELMDAIDAANADDGVRAIIVTGAGRGFCSGADISPEHSWFKNPDGQVRGGKDGGEGGFPMKLHGCLKPIIAAINGPAMGVGITMTLPMDIRIAADDARFGFVFARRGLVPEAGSAFFLPRIVGLPQALRWCYTGETIDAPTALRSGLVSELVPKDRLLDRATEIARQIADNTAPVAIALTRQLLWRAGTAESPMAALAVDAAINRQMASSADVAEGIAAFREKRVPRFPGRPSTDMPSAYPWW
ncbi:MAG: enoyl-CoA hydratase-related protein [Burkholderiaceae bacterium]